MKIIYLADIHIGGPDTDMELRCMEAMLARILAECPDVVCIVGDLIYGVRRKAAAWIRNLWRHFVSTLVDHGIDVIVIRGNHDLLGDFAHLGDIRTELAGRRVECRYLEEPGIVELGKGTVCFYAMPYPDASWLLDADDLPDPGERMTALADGMRDVVEDWHEQREARPDAAHVVLCHAMIDGAQLDINQPLISAEPSLSPDDFAGFDLVLCGHIHYPHMIMGTVSAVHMCGAMWPVKHGEKHQHSRGPMSFRVQDGRATPLGRIDLADVYRKRLTYHLRWSEESSGLIWADDESEYVGVPRRGANAGTTSPTMLDGSVAAVKVSYPKAVRGALDFKELARAFTGAGAHTVKVDPDPEGDERVAPDVFEGCDSIALELKAMWAAMGGAPKDSDALWCDDAMTELEDSNAA